MFALKKLNIIKKCLAKPSLKTNKQAKLIHISIPVLIILFLLASAYWPYKKCHSIWEDFIRETYHCCKTIIQVKCVYEVCVTRILFLIYIAELVFSWQCTVQLQAAMEKQNVKLVKYCIPHQFQMPKTIDRNPAQFNFLSDFHIFRRIKLQINRSKLPFLFPVTCNLIESNFLVLF